MAGNRTSLRHIVGERFQSNPEYSLVLSDRIPAGVQADVETLVNAEDLYGFLLPRERTGLAPRAVDQDTALLFYTLQDPGPIPKYVGATLREDCNRVVAELVLDGVLEIAAGETFLSGAAAHGLVFEGMGSTTVGEGKLARLSLEALRYAQLLGFDDSGRLSTRLYLYNHLPLTPALRRRLGSVGDTPRFLRLGPGGSTEALLGRSWTRTTPDVQNGWLSWTRRIPGPPRGDSRRLYKLYVSPQPLQALDVLVETAQELADVDAVGFKVGGDVHGLLRPDKIVAYFSSFDSLREAASCLELRLAGCEPHGVPFTAEVGGGGLLSWGVDPVHAGEPRTLLAESWRLWITNRLAVALVAARMEPNGCVEPWKFAIDRLRLDGVDTETWTPNQSMFLAR